MPYLNTTEVESALAVATSPPYSAFSQLITLYLTPVIYLTLEKQLQRWRDSRSRRVAVTAGGGTAAGSGD